MITSCAPMPFIRSYMPSPARSSVPSTCSAGNLFDTTRSSHPGVFGALPLRYASTSGGVSSSWPGQNGHCSRPSETVCSKRKSFGRLRRSVEMMTQRPETGSLRNSGIESVLKKFDRGRAGIEMHRHDVEAARTIGQTLAHKIVDRELRDLTLLRDSDRLRRRAEHAAFARLDSYEHVRGAFFLYDVAFST